MMIHSQLTPPATRRHQVCAAHLTEVLHHDQIPRQSLISLAQQSSARLSTPGSQMHPKTCTIKANMVALCMLMVIFVVHAVSVAARASNSALTFQSARRTSQPSEMSKQFLRRPEQADSMVVPVVPFLMSNAEVISEVKGADTISNGTGWAGAMFTRGLLHGKRRPSKYSRCNLCAMISCTSETEICSGHSKKGKKLFTCRRKLFGVIRNLCIDDLPEISNLPADTLAPLRSVAVAATAPFIGCANIFGLPSGCPAAGTRGEFGNGQTFTVLRSMCPQHRCSIRPCERGSRRTIRLASACALQTPVQVHLIWVLVGCRNLGTRRRVACRCGWCQRATRP